MRASLTAEEARGLALRAQRFGDTTIAEPVELLERLGAIQIDSVNILARNHLLRLRLLPRHHELPQPLRPLRHPPTPRRPTPRPGIINISTPLAV